MKSEGGKGVWVGVVVGGSTLSLWPLFVRPGPSTNLSSLPS